jgi:hypothetical protein
MTAVVVAPRFEDLDSDTEPVFTEGRFRIRLSTDTTVGGWVQNVWPPWKTFTGSPITVFIDAATPPYEMEMQLPDGDGGIRNVHEYRVITAAVDPTPWETFTQVDGPGGTPVPPDVVDARLTQLETSVATLSGGASNLANITDMTMFMRGVNAAATAGEARGAIGAGVSDVTIGSTTGTAGDGGVVADLAATVEGKADDAATAHTALDETVTGAWSFTTAPAMAGYYSAAELDTAISDAVAAATITMTSALNGTPMFLFTSAGVYPPRPATGRPVIFRDPTVQPANDGSVEGGGGMVENLDIWFGS